MRNFFIVTLILLLVVKMGNVMGATIFYVSPNGLDTNPGTLSKPWKSFFKAASSAKAGETVIFEDGIYYEDSLSFFLNSGKPELPIVLKAKNKQKAKIIFPISTRVATKINIVRQSYITIQDFEITQVDTANETDKLKTTDILIGCQNSSNCSIIGNLIYNTYEEGVKVNGSTNILVDGNTIISSTHEGIDFVNNSNSIIRNNIIKEIGRVGIVVKGGARNIKVYNNYISNINKMMINSGISVGGMTNKKSTFDNSAKGFEAYSVMVWNNKIISKKLGRIRNGISFMGVDNSYCFNNIIVGALRGFYFITVNGKQNGWGWNPINNNINLKNNIIMDCKESAFIFRNKPNNLNSDYNLFYNNGSQPDEPNSIYKDPLFIDKLSNWDLRSNSPAIGSGQKVPDTLEGFNGAELRINLKKTNSRSKTFSSQSKWNMGLLNNQ